jgi:GNAT superfamily N-acetyltransferase
MADILLVLPESASSEEWARFHAFRRIRQREYRADEPLAPDEVVEENQRRPSPVEYHFRYHVVEEGKMVAELNMSAPRPESPEYATNHHLIWADGYVLEAHRRGGLGHRMLAPVLRHMDELGATVVSLGAEDEPGNAFLRGLGADPRMVERQSRLDLEQVDWDMVERWVREGESASPDTRLECYPDFVPEEELERYTAAMTELLNTMPFEGLDHGDIVVTSEVSRYWRERLERTGSVNPTCVVREPDGSISGMTDVVVHPYEPGIVRQAFTGVHPRARGRKLGKWLKAALLLHIRATYPGTRWITTENAGSNDAMLSINHALGFKLHRTATYYQLDREALRKIV